MKTDDAMKRKLDAIGDIGSLHRRRFIGSSRQDQELWADGGLSFGYDNVVYGSCDFAWFSNEKWEDPYTGKVTDQKPVIVIEATDCLNTRSWGSAQIQRFHHAYGPFLCGINSIYFLNPGKFPIRPYLPVAAYYATKYHRSLGNEASYLVMDDIDQIKKLIQLADEFGVKSTQFKSKVEIILEGMKDYFNSVFSKNPFFNNWIKYFESRAITRMPNGNYIKDLGPRYRSFTDSSQRYGHIIVGEAMTTVYLMIGSKLLNPNDTKFLYLFPLITKKELDRLDETLTRDKEWAIIRNPNSPWKIVTIDDLDGVAENDLQKINSLFKKANLNKVKKEWNETKENIRKGLNNGTIRLKDSKESKNQQQTLI